MVDPGNSGNGWSHYQMLVMDKLNTLEEELAAVDEKVTLLRIDVAQLKVKAGVWGAVAGMIPGVAMGLIIFVLGSG